MFSYGWANVDISLEVWISWVGSGDPGSRVVSKGGGGSFHENLGWPQVVALYLAAVLGEGSSCRYFGLAWADSIHTGEHLILKASRLKFSASVKKKKKISCLLILRLRELRVSVWCGMTDHIVSQPPSSQLPPATFLSSIASECPDWDTQSFTWLSPYQGLERQRSS